MNILTKIFQENGFWHRCTQQKKIKETSFFTMRIPSFPSFPPTSKVGEASCQTVPRADASPESHTSEWRELPFFLNISQHISTNHIIILKSYYLSYLLLKLETALHKTVKSCRDGIENKFVSIAEMIDMFMQYQLLSMSPRSPCTTTHETPWIPDLCIEVWSKDGTWLDANVQVRSK